MGVKKEEAIKSFYEEKDVMGSVWGGLNANV